MSNFKAHRPSKRARRQAEAVRRHIAQAIAKDHKKWTPSQTKLFFKRLSQFGADFPRIALTLNRFPEEIADKYRTERDIDPQQVVRALSVPIAIEPNLFSPKPKCVKPQFKKPCGCYHLQHPETRETVVLNSGPSVSGQMGGVSVLLDGAGSMDEDEDEDDEDYVTDSDSDSDSDSDEDSDGGSDEDLDEDSNGGLDEDSGDEIVDYEVLDDNSRGSLSDDDYFQLLF